MKLSYDDIYEVRRWLKGRRARLLAKRKRMRKAGRYLWIADSDGRLDELNDQIKFFEDWIKKLDPAR